MDDTKEFNTARGAMTVCLFSEQDQWNIWTIVASVMHLGNIVFGETEKRNMPVAFVENSEESSRLVAKALMVC